MISLLIGLLIPMSHAFSDGECIHQWGKFDFVIERDIGPNVYSIKVDKQSPDVVDEYIAKAAILITGMPMDKARVVFNELRKEHAPEETHVTQTAVLVSEFYLDAVPNEIRRVGHTMNKGKLVDLWVTCRQRQ